MIFTNNFPPLSCNPKNSETLKQTIEAKNITIENLMLLMSDASNEEIFISLF
ncbi:hypothetical protein HMPREF3217_00812 [Finegoldia magna]|nr:hypothetical protein HMPREF3217_00812 [Finegoldia magna]